MYILWTTLTQNPSYAPAREGAVGTRNQRTAAPGGRIEGGHRRRRSALAHIYSATCFTVDSASPSTTAPTTVPWRHHGRVLECQPRTGPGHRAGAVVADSGTAVSRFASDAYRHTPCCVTPSPRTLTWYGAVSSRATPVPSTGIRGGPSGEAEVLVDRAGMEPWRWVTVLWARI